MSESRAWHVAVGQRQEGPYETEAVIEGFASGRWPKTALVWSEALPGWTRATDVPIFQKAMALLDELTSGPSRETPDEGFLTAEARMLAGAKKVALMCLGTAVQKRGEALKDDQEVLAHFADIAMETYALESALLRTRKRAAARGEDATRLQEAAVRCYAQDAMDDIEASARKLLAAVEEGDTLRTLLAALKRFTKRDLANTVALRRQVAEAAIEAGGYPLG